MLGADGALARHRWLPSSPQGVQTCGPGSLDGAGPRRCPREVGELIGILIVRVGGASRRPRALSARA